MKAFRTLEFSPYSLYTLKSTILTFTTLANKANCHQLFNTRTKKRLRVKMATNSSNVLLNILKEQSRLPPRPPPLGYLDCCSLAGGVFFLEHDNM